jgi:hypothetical protein
MSARAGDRHGPLVAFQASGDRPASLRCINAALFDLAGRRIALVAMVVDDQLPEIIMFEGEPFLYRAGNHYHQVRPYRADCMVVELPS